MPLGKETPDALGSLGSLGLEKLRSFEGAPTAFWPSFLKELVEAAEADEGLLLIRSDAGWKPIALQPRGGRLLEEAKREGLEVEKLAQQAVLDGTLSREMGSGVLLGVEVTPVGTTTGAVVLLHLSSGGESRLRETAMRVRLGRDVASVYSLQRRLHRVEETVGSYASVLDLLRVLDSRSRYLEAVMTLCNEAAARFNCERVSLGWLEKGNVRLQAISHSEKIEKKMRAVGALEELMEEAVDQDEEVVVPVPAESDTVARAHESFSREQSVANIVSLPLRISDAAVAALTLERGSGEFEESELRSLRLLCDQIATRLADLKKHDRWIGARVWASTRETAAKLVGVEHTGWKLIGAILAVALAVLIFGGGTYRVEAPFILKTDTQVQIPAAFEGFIEDVSVRVGDRVQPGAPLLRLDQKELLLEEASALAQVRQHRSDARRFQAEGELAKMRSALAQAEQVEARLGIVRYRLEQSEMKAPFDGVVVEGDLRERIGSRTDQGEILLKIARLDQLFVEGKVHERNIHLLKEGGTGRIAFASRPQDKFEVVVDRIEPLAIPEEKGNVFLVRCRVEGEIADWWRPGMSGLCKIETERKSYLWMLTRRTTEFIRMKLWW